jgi:hypothetical protein
MSLDARRWGGARDIKPASHKLVLLVLAEAAMAKPMAGGEGQAHQCTLSNATIAEQASVSLPTAERAIAALEDRGLIARTLRYDARGRRTSSTTFLNVAGEAPDAFRARVGASSSSLDCGSNFSGVRDPDQLPLPIASDGKDGPSLPITGEFTTPHRRGGQYLELGVNRVRESAQARSPSLRHRPGEELQEPVDGGAARPPAQPEAWQAEPVGEAGPETCTARAAPPPAKTVGPPAAEWVPAWQPGPKDIDAAVAKYAAKGATREKVLALASKLALEYEGRRRSARWWQSKWDDWLGRQEWTRTLGKAAGKMGVATTRASPAECAAQDYKIAEAWIERGRFYPNGPHPNEQGTKYPEDMLREIYATGKAERAKRKEGKRPCCA